MIKKLFTVFLICITVSAWSQTEDQQRKLEQRKAQIQKEIREFQALLSNEKKKERSVLTEITEKNQKIKLSEKLINTTARQAKLLNDDIYLNQIEINKLNGELKVLKEDYANMILKAYKSRSQQSRIMFILSSDNFLQAYKRMQYMKQYSSFRKIQGQEIRTKMEKLSMLQEKLSGKKMEKEKVLAESEKEKEALEKDRREKEELVRLIQKDKKKYTADIQKKQRESKEIDRQIDRLIRAAIAAANKKTAKATTTKKETAAKAASAPATKIILTGEGKVVADNFRANKGRLPSPVEGYISMGYGDQPHPVQKKIKVHSSGIEITTQPGATVKAVFGGEVMSVQVIAGMKAVYLQHGDYITLYLNLASVNVSKGDKVSIRQSIGTVNTNASTGKAVLKFFVLQNTTYLNPQTWLSI